MRERARVCVCVRERERERERERAKEREKERKREREKERERERERERVRACPYVRVCVSVCVREQGWESFLFEVIKVLLLFLIPISIIITDLCHESCSPVCLVRQNLYH